VEEKEPKEETTDPRLGPLPGSILAQVYDDSDSGDSNFEEDNELDSVEDSSNKDESEDDEIMDIFLGEGLSV